MTIKTLKRKVINGIKTRRKISKKKRIKNIRKKKNLFVKSLKGGRSGQRQRQIQIQRLKNYTLKLQT